MQIFDLEGLEMPSSFDCPKTATSDLHQRRVLNSHAQTLQMTAPAHDWSSPWSNDAFRAMQLSLVRTKDAAEQLDEEERVHLLDTFHPAFVHQIFGESEVIVCL